jgi:hypothetical protein
MKHEVTRVSSETDLERCQAGTSKGQCMNRQVANTEFCPAHGGPAILAKQDQAAIRRFKKSKWFAQIADEHGDQDSLKSLTGEIALLKILQAEILNRCNTRHELIMNQGQLSDLVVKTEKLVTSAHKLQKDMAGLIDRSVLMHFASQIIEIIVAEIGDQDARARISIKITEAFQQATQGQEDDY